MQEKLKELALRYEDLQAQLADPSVYGDAERLKTVNRELKDLTPVARRTRHTGRRRRTEPRRRSCSLTRRCGSWPGGADRRTGRDGAAAGRS